MKKTVHVLIVFLIILYCVGIVNASIHFTDLDVSHWAFHAISKMTEKGIVSGYPEGTFLPSKNVTRAEFAKLLSMSLNLSIHGSSANYIDVKPNHWAYQYVMAVSEYMPENGEMFNPDSTINREQVAYAVVKAMKLDSEGYEFNSINQFSDRNSITAGYEKYIAIVAENKVMNGNADGTFNPLGYLTRAEVTQLLYNILEEQPIIATENDASVSVTATMKNQVLREGETYKVDGTEKINVIAKPKNANIRKIGYYYDNEKNKMQYTNGSNVTITIPANSEKEKKSLVIEVQWQRQGINAEIETTQSIVYLQYITKGVKDTSKSGEDFETVDTSQNNESIIPISKITLDPNPLTLEIGTTATIEATLFPKINDKLTWKSSDIKVATVSDTGVILAKGIGTTIITATSSNGVQGISEVKVVEYIGKPIFNYSTNGSTVKTYSDSSINVKIEKYSNYYITKVWVKAPSTQVKKVEAGWGKKLSTVGTMFKANTSIIVGVNGSGFYKSGSWTPSSTWDKAILKTSWNYTTEGNFVISNGIVRRELSGQKAKTTLGITQEGTFKYYENSAYDELKKDNVYNSFAFGPLLIKDGKKYVQKDTSVRLRQNYTSKAQRTVVGQVDENNYILITTISNSSLNEIASVGLKFNCNILFNLDGGGSTSLWFRNGKTVSGANIKGGGRAVADGLVFLTDE